MNHQNRQFLTTSPLVSPYGSRSNSPGRSSSFNSPNLQRRSGDGNGNGNVSPNQKWGINRQKSLGQSPLAMRKQITSPLPCNTPLSPLAVPNHNYGAKVGTFGQSPGQSFQDFSNSFEFGQNNSGNSQRYYEKNLENREHDIFDYQIETWSNDQYDRLSHQEMRNRNHLRETSQMTRSYSNSSFSKLL